MKRRHLLAAGLGAPLATLAAPNIVRAQAKYPERTVRLVVPFAAAGPTDIIGRKVSEKMTALLGQTMIVDNKSGAAGSIGAVEVKNAKPDGYTLLFAPSSTHAVNPTAFVTPAYDAIKDFTPISSICVNPLVLVTHPSMPDSVMGLVEEMKKNPGKYSYASSGNGSILHLASEYFKREVGGMDVVHVPYRGSGPALQDLLSGQVVWMFETFSTTLQQHRAGKLRILAYAYAKRAAIAPEIPTMIEAGVKGYEAYTFNLILGPAGMPQPVVDTLDQALKGAAAKQIYFVPGEHDMLTDNGEQYLQRYGKGTKGAGWYSFDQKGVHFVGLVNVVNLKAGGLGSLGHEQLEWLEDDLKARSASTPIVLFAHIPLWTIYPDWGWGTDDSEQALSYVKKFGSVTVLNGHIHQVMQKIEGKLSFHTAMSTAFPQPAPGTAPSAGPMKVPADQLQKVLGITDVNYLVSGKSLAIVDSTLEGSTSSASEKSSG